MKSQPDQNIESQYLNRRILTQSNHQRGNHERGKSPSESITMIGQMKKDLQQLKTQMKKYTSFRSLSNEKEKQNNQNRIFQQKKLVSNTSIMNIGIDKNYRRQARWFGTNKPENTQQIGPIKILQCHINKNINGQRTHCKNKQQQETKNTILRSQKSSINQINVQRLRQQNKSLKQEVSQSKKSIKNLNTNLQKEIDSYNNQKVRYEEQIRKERNLRKKTQAQHSRLQNRISELVKSLQQYKKQNQLLKNYIIESSNEKGQLKRSISFLQNNVKNIDYQQKYNNFIIEQNMKLKKQVQNKRNEIENIINKHSSIYSEVIINHKKEIQNYKNKIAKLEQQLKNKTNNQKCLNQNKNQEFNQLMKSHILQTESIKQKLKNSTHQIFILTNQLQNQKIKIENIQHNNSIQKMKLQVDIQNVQNKLKMQIQNINQERQVYQKTIIEYQQKLLYLLNENLQKDNFMKQYLIEVAKGEKDRSNIFQFFEQYQINIPKYSMAQYIFQEIHNKFVSISKQVVLTQ